MFFQLADFGARGSKICMGKNFNLIPGLKPRAYILEGVEKLRI